MDLALLEYVSCPGRLSQRCAGALTIVTNLSFGELGQTEEGGGDLEYGVLMCDLCGQRYPVLGGVAILVPEAENYVRDNSVVISRYVSPTDLLPWADPAVTGEGPTIEGEKEWDLNSERVLGWYATTSYPDAVRARLPWPYNQEEKAADQAAKNSLECFAGPLVLLDRWLNDTEPEERRGLYVDLGCHIGGGVRLASGRFRMALGMDLSFAPVYVGRRLLRNAKGIYLPFVNAGDRLWTSERRSQILGPLSKGPAELVVADLRCPPLRSGSCEFVSALSVSDMLEEPEILPRIQRRLVADRGFVVHMDPYCWPQKTAEHLRMRVSDSDLTSASLMESLYKSAGLSVVARKDGIPWAFRKHERQVEIYIIHALLATRLDV